MAGGVHAVVQPLPYARRSQVRGVEIPFRLVDTGGLLPGEDDLPYVREIEGQAEAALATAEEENFFSKSVSVEPSKTRIGHPFIASELGRIEGYKIVASGYTAVWAKNNTRADIINDKYTASFI